MESSDEDIDEILEEDEIDGDGKAFFDIGLRRNENIVFYIKLPRVPNKMGGNLILLWMFFSLTCPYFGLLQSI